MVAVKMGEKVRLTVAGAERFYCDMQTGYAPFPLAGGDMLRLPAGFAFSIGLYKGCGLV